MGDTVLGNALCGRPLAGVLLWMVAAGTYPDYDSYTCRIPGTEESCGPPTEDWEAVRLCYTLLSALWRSIETPSLH